MKKHTLPSCITLHIFILKKTFNFEDDASNQSFQCACDKGSNQIQLDSIRQMIYCSIFSYPGVIEISRQAVLLSSAILPPDSSLDGCVNFPQLQGLKHPHLPFSLSLCSHFIYMRASAQSAGPWMSASNPNNSKQLIFLLSDGTRALTSAPLFYPSGKFMQNF